MRKINFLWVLVIAIVMPFTLTSCSEDDIFTPNMAGAWQSVQRSSWIKKDGKLVENEEFVPFDSELMWLNAKGEGRMYIKSYKGDWKLDDSITKLKCKGDKLYMYYDDGGYDLFNLKESGGILTIYFYEHDIQDGVRVDSFDSWDYQKVEIPPFLIK